MSYSRFANIRDFALHHNAFLMWDGGECFTLTWGTQHDVSHNAHSMMYTTDDQAAPRMHGCCPMPQHLVAQFQEQLLTPLWAAARAHRIPESADGGSPNPMFAHFCTSFLGLTVVV